MAFGQLAATEGLHTLTSKLQRTGFRSPVLRKAVPKRTLRPDLSTAVVSKSGLRPKIFARIPSSTANSNLVPRVMPERLAAAVSALWVRVPEKLAPFLQTVPVPDVLACTRRNASSGPHGIANPESLLSFPPCLSTRAGVRVDAPPLRTALSAPLPLWFRLAARTFALANLRLDDGEPRLIAGKPR